MDVVEREVLETLYEELQTGNYVLDGDGFYYIPRDDELSVWVSHEVDAEEILYSNDDPLLNLRAVLLDYVMSPKEYQMTVVDKGLVPDVLMSVEDFNAMGIKKAPAMRRKGRRQGR